MARGDYKTFDEAFEYMFDSNWASGDGIKLAICNNTTAPTVSTTTPNLSDFTQIGTGGTYPSGGYALDTWGTMVQRGGNGSTNYAMIDTGTNPVVTSSGSNDNNAYWGIVYNSNRGNAALGFLDLGGPVDLTAGNLTITWNANGLTRITRN